MVAPAITPRVPATGLTPISDLCSDDPVLTEIPEIPGLEIAEDGSMFLRDGTRTLGLWRVAKGIAIVDRGFGYIFKTVPANLHDRSSFVYSIAPDGTRQFSRCDDKGRRMPHCEFEPAVVRPDGTREWYINGRLSRTDGPAIERPDGTSEWFRAGRRHRKDGLPAVEYRDQDNKEWWVKGKRHRDDGPAVTGADGYQEFWQEGRMHRDDGPAKILANGAGVHYYRDGQVHRDDGPAVESVVAGGVRREYWQHGRLHRTDGPAAESPGTSIWYRDGERHRDGGPAVIEGDYTAWFRRGERHREDGPAVQQDGKPDEFWLDDEKIDEEEWRRRTRHLRPTPAATPAAAGASVRSLLQRTSRS
ncbi:hypothetical protein [Miltoncostaea oceani]|uniref:hypothetical protein n=1 Tax=Miltoncostaea oceani TaxID=2843216 RepID=UPI001C3DF1C3|nr:hypothetical protein [Miltoncostaea oceani]